MGAADGVGRGASLRYKTGDGGVGVVRWSWRSRYANTGVWKCILTARKAEMHDNASLTDSSRTDEVKNNLLMPLGMM